MRQRIKEILSTRYPARVWTVIIFILLALPGNMLPSETHTSIPNLDKLVHITLFACFVFFWSVWSSSKEKNKFPYGRYAWYFIIGCLYGIAMEYVQKYFIPNRDFDLYDILADIAGAFLGLLIVQLTVSKFKVP